MSLDICTLGDFDVRRDGCSVLKKNRQAHRNLELLAYFMTNRGKKLSAKTITETLWGDRNNNDPQNALRAQIFRLRKLMREAGLSGDGPDCEEAMKIRFENGFYVFTLGEGCSLDVELFEGFVKEGDLLRDIAPDEAIRFYIRALRIYEGDYLENATDREWAFVIRNRYHRLYIQSVLRLFKLFKEQERWKDVTDYFESAVVFEPLEESMHLFYLEALLNLGEYKIALSHYNYITAYISRELDAKPSPAFKSIYSKIVAGKRNVAEADIFALRRDFLREDRSGGALYCELEYFKMIYNLEERKSARGKNDALVGLVSLVSDGIGIRTDALMEKLKVILRCCLRQGDVFTVWNRCQMILLLPDAPSVSMDLICRRIKSKFHEDRETKDVELRFSFEPIYEKLPLLNLG